MLKRVLNCCLLNGGVFWVSINLFEYGLLPGLQILLHWLFGPNSGNGAYVWSWMQPLLSIMFGMIWVLPLFLLSRIVNSLWFQVRGTMKGSIAVFMTSRTNGISNNFSRILLILHINFERVVLK